MTSAVPEYSGIHFLTTAIHPDNRFYLSAASLAGEGMYMALGDDKQLLVVKLGDGSYQVGVGLRLPQGWSSDNASLLKDPLTLRKWLAEGPFADWPKAHTDMIRHSDGDFLNWPLYAMPTEALSWQTVPGVALVGDAAHLT